MATMVDCVCANCGKVFQKTLSEYNVNIKKGNKLYCSKECFNKYREAETVVYVKCSVCGAEVRRYKNRCNDNGKYFCKECRGKVEVRCKTCGKSIMRTKHDVRKYDELYCSNECKAIGNRKEWNDLSRNMLKYHWIMVFGEESLVCNRCGHNKPYNIQLHHKIYVKDGGDNIPDNIELLCRNCHGIEHYENGEDVDF